MQADRWHSRVQDHTADSLGGRTSSILGAVLCLRVPEHSSANVREKSQGCSVSYPDTQTLKADHRQYLEGTMI